MSSTELRVSKIKEGTVIDHISGGYALDVVKILGITGKENRVMTIAINVPSKSLKVKDIVLGVANEMGVDYFEVRDAVRDILESEGWI